MRTTLQLGPEVVAAAEHLRRERHIGLDEAIDELTCTGLTQKRKPVRFQQQTAEIGLRVDATDIAGTLELLGQYDAEDAQ